MTFLKIIKEKYYWGLYPLIATCLLLMSSYATAPFFGVDTGDSSWYILIGESVLKGKIIYRDLFDHKGPLLFFIQALGQLIHRGDTGILILQIINLSIVLFLIRKISLFFIRPTQLWIIIFSVLIFWLAMNSGNRCEEFSLIFIFIPIVYALKYGFSGDVKHPSSYALIYGICFGATSFIRLNNSAISAAIMLSVFIILLMNKQWKNALANTAFFISGFLIVCLPLCIYFYVHDTLYDMIYASFLHNIMYSSVGEYSPRWIVLLSLMFVLIAVFNVLIYSQGKKYCPIKIIIPFIVVFNFIAMNFSTRFVLYYHILDIPTIVLGIALFICNYDNNRIRKSKKILNVFLFSIALIQTGYYVTNGIRALYGMFVFDQSLSLNYPPYQIPEKDKDSVIGYNVSARWYLTQNVLPCYKYFTMQEWLAKTNPQILTDFNNMIINDTPKWILVSSNTEQMSPKISRILKDKYEIKASTPVRPSEGIVNYDEYGYVLYHLKNDEK